MKRLFLLILINSSLFLRAQQTGSAVEAQFKSLHWLAGNWERINVKPGRTASEKWELASLAELKGLGVTMKGRDTVFLEKIQLKIEGDHIYYIADVEENKQPVYFKLVETGSTGFVCENPTHDFPKKIVYRLKKNSLTVTISGDGRSQDYLFIRR